MNTWIRKRPFLVRIGIVIALIIILFAIIYTFFDFFRALDILRG